ncbi:MAG TPA: long-chain-fatty-acid--CoA ligase [Chloroflexota bacterium]|nr:long-chain-fatty-acid--CoA ligase [Chloroflexota bacterium]
MYITQGLKRAALVNAQGIATIDGERQHTWREFADRVARLAGALISLGLKTDDRVAMLALNSDRHLEYYFATIWAGGIFVPLNTRLAPPELGSILSDAGAHILVIDDALQPQLAKIANHTTLPEHIIFAGDGEPVAGLIHHEAFLSAAAPMADANRGGDDVATIIYTGGTTGLPKGVMLTHTNAVSNALSSLAVLYDGEPWTYLHTAPMFHIADIQWNTGVTMVGGTHVFTRRFVPQETLELISRHQITHMALVPTMINMLCQVSGVEAYDVSSLRKVNFGGSSIAPSVIRRARELFPHCQFIQGYGQTETSPNVAMLLDKYNTDEGPFAGKIESAGQPVFAMEVRIVDVNDEEVPHGAIGEITAKGPHVMRGYWNKPEETAHALRGGWMHTGDVGYLDEDGFIFIVDRLKDMIISGGENVYSTEVEHVIYQHTAVADCAVIGIPYEKWGETVHAIVVPKVGFDLTAEEIMAYCRQHIAGYKCPRSVEIRLEPLPMSGAGKILKKVLRAPYWADITRQIN